MLNHFQFNAHRRLGKMRTEFKNLYASLDEIGHFGWMKTNILDKMFLGCQSDGGSLSRQQFWHTITSVNMVRLHSICNRTVSRRQRVLVVVTCVLHRRDSWSLPERGRNTATAASLFKDLVSGTVFLLS